MGVIIDPVAYLEGWGGELGAGSWELGMILVF
jgi:hypothetical protein